MLPREENHKLRRDGQPDLSIIGELIAQASSKNPISGPQNNRWTNLDLYRSGAQYVLAVTDLTIWDGEPNGHAVHVCGGARGVIEVLTDPFHGLSAVARALLGSAGLEPETGR